MQQFDPNRGEKSLLSQPAPSLGKLCRAGSSTGLCCISKQENENHRPCSHPLTQEESPALISSGRKRNIIQKCPFVHSACHYIFCHYSLILNNIYKDEESSFTVMGQMTRKAQHSLIEQEQISSCVAGRCFMGYLFF